MLAPTPSEASLSPSVLVTFRNKEVLKALMHQIPEYNSSGGVPNLLEFVDQFKAFCEASELSTILELCFATFKQMGDTLI